MVNMRKLSSSQCRTLKTMHQKVQLMANQWSHAGLPVPGMMVRLLDTLEGCGKDLELMMYAIDSSRTNKEAVLKKNMEDLRKKMNNQRISTDV
ncbi:hypothetical protein [Klebsiella aerogenes]|uniref:Uncharacterized protein n=1 Tax=Klebsiella aerogenes TaxID=548 RepID=A0AAP9R1C8_KLEAE|nr:hypothetical protein [Klebsiella aerogenes]QMR42836.1 hypothetical protein HV331_25240 [Klebsiella aerogenes]